MSKVTNNVVFMDRGNYTTCTVHLHGGTILSYRVQNREMLYMNPTSAFNNYSPIVGGIKITFPYFGRRINGPKHGFAKSVPWTLEEGPTTKDDGNVEAVFSLTESEYTKAIWNYQFKLSFRLTLCMNQLRMAFKVENTSKHFPFSFTVLKHSIFKVSDVRKCEIYGLFKSKYVKLDEDSPIPIEQDLEKVIIDRYFLDLYLDTSGEVEVRNIDDQGLKLKITATNFTSKTEVLIYNRWNEEAHGVADPITSLGVGNGHLSSDIRLAPKEIWESFTLIEVVNEEQEKKVDQLGILLDNPLEMFKKTCAKTYVYSGDNT